MKDTDQFSLFLFALRLLANNIIVLVVGHWLSRGCRWFPHWFPHWTSLLLTRQQYHQPHGWSVLSVMHGLNPCTVRIRWRQLPMSGNDTALLNLGRQPVKQHLLHQNLPPKLLQWFQPNCTREWVRVVYLLPARTIGSTTTGSFVVLIATGSTVLRVRSTYWVPYSSL